MDQKYTLMTNNCKKIIIILVMMGALFCLGGCFNQASAQPAATSYPNIVDMAGDSFETIDGTVLIKENTIIEQGLLKERREYDFPYGDVFYQERITLAEQKVSVDPSASSVNSLSTLQQISAISLTGNSGTIRYYDYDSEEWVVGELAPGVYPARQYFIDTPGRSLILVPPQAYQARENQMLEAVPSADGLIQISKGNSHFLITIYIPEAADYLQYEYMYLSSSKPLIDWQEGNNQQLWSACLFDNEHRWCWDGYYYLSPSNYIPAGENYYHRLPAAYIAANMVNYDSRAAKSFCLAMLDILLDLQNDQGYFPTYAGSQWLYDDYQINPGFYDSRYNSDLVYAYGTAAEKYNVPHFMDAVVKYGKFFIEMAEHNHYTVTTEQGEYGWLVYDYWHPDYFLATHTSLNHQTAEIINLFMLAKISGSSEYLQVAEYMINGITALGDRWVKDNHDLYYAYMGNDEMGLSDYPYLTYNDLYNLQKILEEYYGERNPVLQQLMDEKKIWMDQNRVQGYKQ